MSAPPYMRLYWADYHQDTRHLTREEHGAYFLLLGEAWNRGGYLPDDDALLARWTLATPEEWARLKPIVMAFFRPASRLRWRHKRIGEELASYDVVSRKRKTAGKRGGSSSHGKDAVNPEAIAKQLPTKPEPEPEPEPDKSLSEPKGSSPRAVAAKPNGFARFWEAYPNKVAKAAAERAYVKALKSIPGPDPPGVILAGVERAKASRAWIEGYIPHPATWLNRGSWDDQPAEITGPRHERPHPDPRAAAFRERLGDIDAAMAAAVVERGG